MRLLSSDPDEFCSSKEGDLTEATESSSEDEELDSECGRLPHSREPDLSPIQEIEDTLSGSLSPSTTSEALLRPRARFSCGFEEGLALIWCPDMVSSHSFSPLTDATDGSAGHGLPLDGNLMEVTGIEGKEKVPPVVKVVSNGDEGGQGPSLIDGKVVDRVLAGSALGGGSDVAGDIAVVGRARAKGVQVAGETAGRPSGGGKAADGGVGRDGSSSSRSYGQDGHMAGGAASGSTTQSRGVPLGEDQGWKEGRVGSRSRPGGPFEEHEPTQQRLVLPPLSTPSRFEVLWSAGEPEPEEEGMLTELGRRHLEAAMGVADAVLEDLGSPSSPVAFLGGTTGVGVEIENVSFVFLEEWFSRIGVSFGLVLNPNALMCVPNHAMYAFNEELALENGLNVFEQIDFPSSSICSLNHVLSVLHLQLVLAFIGGSFEYGYESTGHKN
ncbi:hypothetical protein Dimus_032044 [Dionaea muscipula]